MPRKITDAEAARIAHGQREIDRERLSEDALTGLRSLPLSGPELDRARTGGPVTLSGWYAAEVDGRACWVEYGEVGSLGAKALRGHWLEPARKLKSEDPSLGADVVVAAFNALHPELKGRVEAVFEHDQWWIIAEIDDPDWPQRTFSVVDASGPPERVCDGLAFED